MVPGKNAGELNELQLLAVQLHDDLRAPMLVDEREFLVKGSLLDLAHASIFTVCRAGRRAISLNVMLQIINRRLRVNRRCRARR